VTFYSLRLELILNLHTSFVLCQSLDRVNVPRHKKGTGLIPTGVKSLLITWLSPALELSLFQQDLVGLLGARNLSGLNGIIISLAFAYALDLIFHIPFVVAHPYPLA
jgi:hypothetical protein